MAERPPANDRMSLQSQTRTGHVVQTNTNGDIDRVLVVIEGIGQQYAEYLGTSELTVGQRVRVRPQPEAGGWRIVNTMTQGAAGISLITYALTDPNDFGGDYQFYAPTFLAVHPSGNWVVTAYDPAASLHLQVWAWNGTSFTINQDFSTGRSDSLVPGRADFSHDGAYLAVAFPNSPRIKVYPFNESIGQFSAAVSDPSTLPDSAGTPHPRWLNDDSVLFLGQSATAGSVPGVVAYNWSAGFGSKIANPATLTTLNGPCSIAVSPRAFGGDHIVIVTDGANMVAAYRFSGTAWGTRVNADLTQFVNPPAVPVFPDFNYNMSLIGFSGNNQPTDGEPWLSLIAWKQGNKSFFYPEPGPRYGRTIAPQYDCHWHPTLDLLLVPTGLGLPPHPQVVSVFDFRTGIVGYPAIPVSYNLTQNEIDDPDAVALMSSSVVAWHPNGEVFFAVGSDGGGGYGQLAAYRYNQ